MECQKKSTIDRTIIRDRKRKGSHVQNSTKNQKEERFQNNLEFKEIVSGSKGTNFFKEVKQKEAWERSVRWKKKSLKNEAILFSQISYSPLKAVRIQSRN